MSYVDSFGKTIMAAKTRLALKIAIDALEKIASPKLDDYCRLVDTQ